ncbi:hypothetical protein GX50_04271 [[Emmonsia] crescens]|uniref:Uncharacterized protein n=1 Tax=[Emmonsia] crescens TaxID=73230 RepID=A0A2B7ZJC5_9EURO|nr:hypothetical protein GX50_04271 [Emmonsia crescens]
MVFAHRRTHQRLQDAIRFPAPNKKRPTRELPTTCNTQPESPYPSTLVKPDKSAVLQIDHINYRALELPTIGAIGPSHRWVTPAYESLKDGTWGRPPEPRGGAELDSRRAPGTGVVKTNGA